MDLRMHWVQDGRMRSHCSAQSVERVLLRTMNKQKGVGGTYPQSSLPARPTSVGRAAMEGHGDQQLIEIIYSECGFAEDERRGW
jgi:hypothetical protein